MGQGYFAPAIISNMLFPQIKKNQQKSNPYIINNIRILAIKEKSVTFAPEKVSVYSAG